MTLDIIMPVFNEAQYLEQIVGLVQAAPAAGMAKRLIIVDDGSTDGSGELIRALAGQTTLPGVPGSFDRPILALEHAVNRGKGAAVRTGLAAVEAELVIIQDADLEYDPADYDRLLEPLLAGAKVVYGSRFMGGMATLPHLWLANRALTAIANALFGTRLTDMETCYKALRSEVLAGLALVGDGFEIEPEITAKLALAGHAIVEVPIGYRGRRAWQNKKIRWYDAATAVKTMLAVKRRSRRSGKI